MEPIQQGKTNVRIKFDEIVFKCKLLKVMYNSPQNYIRDRNKGFILWVHYEFQLAQTGFKPYNNKAMLN